jgi:gas vesicle protein
VKKILFGGILAAAAFYYLHPEAGAERRKRLSSLWGSRKDTVLEAARSTSSVVAEVSQEVGDRVGTKIAGIRTEGDRTNGNTLTGAASTRSTDS